DCQALRDVFRQRGDEIAAVIVEPVAGNMGLVEPTAEFRQELRRLTLHYGTVLIYDEVMTGFRLAYGGAQELYDEAADLTILGKILGGGFPVGAYGGRRDIMRQVMPAGPVFQAGTLSGNPVAMAAGIATLRQLQLHPPYRYLETLGRELQHGLQRALDAAHIPGHVQRVGSMWTLFFTHQPVTNYTTARQADTQRFARFFWEMMDRGIYLPCSQFEAAFLSAAMTPEHIHQTLDAAQQALQALRP
ncbi:MAG: aminotransferase class III-fold pyridoxal phosphate-dependent enzyme, partial [Gemmataceae bacterium]|nr:aminotransferase class III-fold pyridoxal phosphate-dependent enzyme [Gemmataceae bacterium]